ncbi:ASCH domain-containing protein [Maricaulaceae bacterium EIL42A08]|nr:ASCH domain-containing protein [Maricaulaceae bacterium EIL42A08]
MSETPPFAPVLSYPAPKSDLNAEYRRFWTRYQAATGETADAPRYVDAFGDSPEMQDELLALVLSRTKQATASLARWYDEATLPTVGDLVLITDGSGAPRCVIRTTQVDIIPVREVDADFAWAEGEGDRSYDYWITEHRKFWQREAAREGFEYSDDLDVVCERFEWVWAG